MAFIVPGSSTGDFHHRSQPTPRLAASGPRCLTKSAAQGASILELVADRQLADPLAGGSEDRVAQRRCNRRHTGFTHTTERHAEIGGKQMDANVARSDVHTGDLIVVEIALLDPACLEGDFGEIKTVGAKNSATRTPAQTEIARFWEVINAHRPLARTRTHWCKCAQR